MDDPYITLNNDYIESVWHILSTIHEKGLAVSRPPRQPVLPVLPDDAELP